MTVHFTSTQPTLLQHLPPSLSLRPPRPLCLRRWPTPALKLRRPLLPPTVRPATSPHSLPDDGWDRVAAGLRMLGVTAEDLDVAAAAHEFAQQEASKSRDTYGVKVAERLALQARLEAAALRGEYATANAAWDRLFDVVTALRGRESMARRRKLPDADVKAELYDDARLDSLKIKQWARGLLAA